MEVFSLWALCLYSHPISECFPWCTDWRWCSFEYKYLIYRHISQEKEANALQSASTHVLLLASTHRVYTGGWNCTAFTILQFTWFYPLILQVSNQTKRG
jgi:hypothetical protein